LEERLPNTYWDIPRPSSLRMAHFVKSELGRHKKEGTPQDRKRKGWRRRKTGETRKAVRKRSHVTSLSPVEETRKFSDGETVQRELECVRGKSAAKEMALENAVCYKRTSRERECVD